MITVVESVLQSIPTVARKYVRRNGSVTDRHWLFQTRNTSNMHSSSSPDDKCFTRLPLTVHNVVDVGLFHCSGKQVRPRTLGVHDHVLSKPIVEQRTQTQRWKAQDKSKQKVEQYNNSEGGGIRHTGNEFRFVYRTIVRSYKYWVTAS